MDEPVSPAAIRLIRESEYGLLGAITVNSYREGGFLDGPDDPYADDLRDVAARAATAEVLVAADADDAVLGGVTYVLPGSPMADMAGPGEAEIRMLAVDPAGHGRGTGTALARACVERARRDPEIKRIVLCSLTTMHGAHRIYERIGFKRAPELDWEPIEDVLLLGFVLEL